MPFDRADLYTALNEPTDRMFFGVCYSILTWSGVGKGFSFMSPGSGLKMAGKLIEDGHAMTFLLTPNVMITTGIGDNQWVFDVEGYWGRATGSSNTYVYYLEVDGTFADRYMVLATELRYTTPTQYAVVTPNVYGSKTSYQNCVSSSHYLMYRLGLGSWVSSKGWWMPSASNWSSWFSSFASSHSGWKYKSLPNTNTHIP